MSSNAFNQSEREYNRAEEMREHSAMERKASIADSAIYQHTAYMAEKYKAQRDALLVALLDITERNFTYMGKDADLSDRASLANAITRARIMVALPEYDL